MAATLYQSILTFDDTIATIPLVYNTWYRVIGRIVIFNSTEYTNGEKFYSGLISIAYVPFGDTVAAIAILYQSIISYDSTIYYFYEGNGTLTTQLTDNISLPRLADYTIDLNSNNSSGLQELNGLIIGQKLTYDEINALILANANITATVDNTHHLISEIITQQAI